MFTGQQNNASAVSNRDSGCDIIREEKLLNGNGIRHKHMQQLCEIRIDSAQPGREAGMSRSCYDTAFFENTAVILIRNNTEPDGSDSRIYSDNSH